MPNLPTGTVTLLFTDIEGSTRLLERLAAGYGDVLAAHQALLRAAWDAHGGVQVSTEGDAFFVAFADAGAAVAAAAEAQRALAANSWPAGAPVRVRMGLHTGTPTLADGTYVGMDVHRAERIAAAAHGGQTLLSATTRALVEAAPPPDVVLRDLGSHRLKDLPRPEHLYQLVVAGLPADFPPPRTLDRPQHNLPTPPTSLLGREATLGFLVGLLSGESVRLLTLTGPGGIGKTRLAIQVAGAVLDVYPDGVWWVGLARLTDPALVVPTIAHTLGVREGGGQPVAEGLRDHVGDKRLLLVLDNFEQVVGAAAALAALLAEHSGLRILATSRIPLHIRGEREVPIPPLGVPPRTDPRHPPTPERLETYAAVLLFLERARAVKPDFALTAANAPAVAAICEALDGLPLALELAAARVKLLPPPALLPRLRRGLAVLSGGAADLDERQQTLRAAIAWSEDLLTTEQRRLFRRLAVFVGGATLEAVEAVCVAPAGAAALAGDALEGLAALVDQSLVRQSDEGGDDPRFTMLQTIREYALERIEQAASAPGEALGATGASDAGEAAAVRDAHLAFFLALAEEADAGLRGGEQGAWLERLEHEHDNLRAALAWTRERGELELGLRLAAALGKFWRRRGYLTEGRGWLEALLGQAGLDVVTSSAAAAGVAPGMAGGAGHAEVPISVRGRALYHAGSLAMWQKDNAVATTRLEAVLALAPDMDERLTELGARNELGILGYGQGDMDRAEAHFSENLALARAIQANREIGIALGNLGEIARVRGDWAQAVRYAEEVLALFRRLGDRLNEGNTLANLGHALLRQGDIARAETLGRESIAVVSTLGVPLDMAETLELLAMTAAARAAATNDGAVEGTGESATAAADSGAADAALAPAERAARLLGAAENLRETVGAPLTALQQADIEPALAGARAQLGEERWQAALVAGRALTRDEAIAEALTGGA
jgi:predicted ATPase/class 3 adenylate cyclase